MKLVSSGSLVAIFFTFPVSQTRHDRPKYQLKYCLHKRCHEQNVLHVDLKFDPQAHQRRGIDFEVFFNGIHQAQIDVQKELGTASQLIMCFQRDASLASAEDAYSKALNHREHIASVGLDNTEVLNFPAEFIDLFRRARQDGFKLTSHCDLGQPSSVEHIRASIQYPRSG